ncbi:MAG: stage II sporulation protein M [Methanobrevibacter sp.]|nr:stage II sporulation protein M [Methanobrevibacter sp.]
MKLYEKGLFQRNKKFFAIALFLFAASFLMGAAVSYQNIGDQYGMVTKTVSHMVANNQPVLEGIAEMDTIAFFYHNMVADFIAIAGGFLFSVISVWSVMYNAFLIGSPFGSDFTFAALSILPHGIIEYSASVISLVVAFNITKLEIDMIKNRSFKRILLENKTRLKDILLLTIIVVILLAIAAFIECNITGRIVYWYFGIS